MSTYTDASLIYYPSGYKASKAYSLKPTDGSGDLTFTRASSATRVNEQGLIEGVRTNLALYSEQFDNAAWVKSNSVTITPNTVISVDGTLNGSNLNFNNVGFANSLSFSFTTLSSTYTQSIFVKYVDSQFVQLFFGSSGFGGGSVTFDILNGTKGLESQGAIGSINDYGNGWYRITAKKTSTGGSTQSLSIVTVTNINASRFGSESNGNVSIWGAMLEQSASATEYIPTTTTAVSVGMLANVPRIDYTSGCGKLLLEPQRTNLFTYSEDFSVSWSGNQLDFNVNNVISPDGTQNADFIIENTTSNPHFLFQTIGTTTISDYTISVFAKYNGRILQIFAGGGDISGNPYANFDLENGLFNNNGCNDAFIEDYGNGWYRCGIVVTSAVTIGFNPCFGLANTLGSTRAATYVGNGTSGVYLWGAQVE